MVPFDQPEAAFVSELTSGHVCFLNLRPQDLINRWITNKPLS